MAWEFEGKEVLVLEKSKLTREEIRELQRRGARRMIFEDIGEDDSCSNSSSKSSSRSGCGSSVGCGLISRCGSSSHYGGGCSMSSCGS